MTNIVDTHTHISKEYYEDVSQIIKDANKAKVKTIVTSACARKDFDETLDIINKYDGVYATFGFHPEEVDNVSEEDLKLLEKLVNGNKKIIGIGEIGLDYNYRKDNRKQQIELFEKQLEIAQRLNYPVVIHSRDAAMDTYNTLKKYDVRGIIHCFSGSYEMAKQYINLGFLLGIGGVITFKNCKLSEVINLISLENIVLETDAPYLAPVPYRGKKNQSSYIVETAKFIAKVKDIPVTYVEKITTENALSLFDLN